MVLNAKVKILYKHNLWITHLMWLTHILKRQCFLWSGVKLPGFISVYKLFDAVSDLFQTVSGFTFILYHKNLFAELFIGFSLKKIYPDGEN